ncbi:MAG: hypothetical protein QOF61_2949, partial [Acidobacteriota bacterium]|nr:hypothetical protein [Acidobacteriota bacterium]
MSKRKLFAAIICVASLPQLAATHTPAQTQTASKTSPPASNRFSPAPSQELQTLVDGAARVALQKFADKKLTESQLAITVIDLRDPTRPV